MTVPVFPTLFWQLPVLRSPVWSTLKQASISGQETRLALWSYPQWRYELACEVLRSSAAFAEWQAIIGVYNQCNGSAGTFTYADPNDGTATAQQIGTGDGVNRVFQLVRAFGGFIEPVFAPVTSTLFQTTGGVTTAISTTAYTISATGVVTFTVAPAAGLVLSWTGTFVWLCRFDDDNLDFQQDYGSIWSLKSCKFTTVKL